MGRNYLKKVLYVENLANRSGTLLRVRSLSRKTFVCKVGEKEVPKRNTAMAGRVFDADSSVSISTSGQQVYLYEFIKNLIVRLVKSVSLLYFKVSFLM